MGHDVLLIRIDEVTHERSLEKLYFVRLFQYATVKLADLRERDCFTVLERVFLIHAAQRQRNHQEYLFLTGQRDAFMDDDGINGNACCAAHG